MLQPRAGDEVVQVAPFGPCLKLHPSDLTAAMRSRPAMAIIEKVSECAPGDYVFPGWVAAQRCAENYGQGAPVSSKILLLRRESRKIFYQYMSIG
jgi:hypothetical protein